MNAPTMNWFKWYGMGFKQVVRDSISDFVWKKFGLGKEKPPCVPNRFLERDNKYLLNGGESFLALK
jgi:hypothetical protein